MMHIPLLRAQRGITLIESLLAVLIFSVGILSVVALQSTSIKATSEAKYRADAAYLANSIVAKMWVANRTDAANTNHISTYAHYPTGAACSPTGAASTNANVTPWLNQVVATLPGATAAMQQITVGANNVVTVNLCWQVGKDRRQLQVISQLNG